MRLTAFCCALLVSLASIAHAKIDREIVIDLEGGIVQQRAADDQSLPRSVFVIDLAPTSDGVEAFGYGPSFNRSDHPGRVTRIERTPRSLKATVEFRIIGDPWIPGGRAGYEIELTAIDDVRLEGTYRGWMRNPWQTIELNGKATAAYQPARLATADGFVPVKPNERPHVLFRAHELPELRERIRTDPLSRRAYEKIKAAADAAPRADVDWTALKFDASMRDQAVACGFVSQIEQDPSYAMRALPLVRVMIRHGYHNGSFNLPEPWGFNVSRIGYTYDLCYDAWPTEVRQEIAGHLAYMIERMMLRTNTISQKMNWNPGSNYQPGTRGGASIAALALLGTPGSAPAAPRAPTPLDAVEPISDFAPGEQVSIEPLVSGQMPTKWLVAGPIARFDARSLDALGGPTGSAIRAGEVAGMRFVRIEDEQVFIHERHTGNKPSLDLTAIGNRQPEQSVVAYTVLEIERPITVRVALDHQPNAQLHVAGRRVFHQDHLKLQPGVYPMLVIANLGNFPSHGKVWLTPNLVEVSADEANHKIADQTREYDAQLADHREARAAWERTGGIDPNATRLSRLGQRYMLRYYQAMMGDGGFQAEGEGYTGWSSPLALEYAHAHHVMFGRSVSPRPDMTHFLARYVTHTLFPEGKDPVSQHFGHGGNTMEVKHLLRGVRASDPQFQPALRWWWARQIGALSNRADARIGGEPVDLILTILNFPPDATIAHPRESTPKTWAATGRGLYVFRNAYEGADDIVAQVHLRSQPPAGWNHPNAGAIRIYGLGKRWAIEGINNHKAGERIFESVVMMPEDDLNLNGFALPLHHDAKPDGSGSITMDMVGVYRGPRVDRVEITGPDGKPQIEERRSAGAGHRGWDPASLRDIGIRGVRAFAADYSTQSGAPAVFVLVDHIEGGGPKHWVWQLDKLGAGYRVDVEGNRFTITQGDASLVGTFIAPADVRLEIDQGSRELRFVKSSTHMTWETKKFTLNHLRASAADPTDGRFMVILTLQRGDAPPVKVDGAGVDATVHVGQQRVRWDGQRIHFGD